VMCTWRLFHSTEIGILKVDFWISNALNFASAKILIGSPNQVEAITANFEKREPKFGDVG
jgi:hypothetical protein